MELQENSGLDWGLWSLFDRPREGVHLYLQHYARCEHEILFSVSALMETGTRSAFRSTTRLVKVTYICDW